MHFLKTDTYSIFFRRWINKIIMKCAKYSFGYKYKEFFELEDSLPMSCVQWSPEYLDL